MKFYKTFARTEKTRLEEARYFLGMSAVNYHLYILAEQKLADARESGVEYMCLTQVHTGTSFFACRRNMKYTRACFFGRY